MPVYLLTPTPTESIGYDEFGGFVIVATDEGEARARASRRGDDSWDRPGRWLDPRRSKCEVVDEKVHGIVLAEFRAG